MAVGPDDLLEVVDVEQEEVVDVAHGRVDVAGHGDIDHEKRPPAPAVHRLVDHLRRDDETGSRGRGNDDVDLLEAVAEVGERHRLAAEAARQLPGPFEGPVGDQEPLDAAVD